MDGSLDEAKRPGLSPATAREARAHEATAQEARAIRLGVVIDGRLDAARARQVVTLTDRLGLAGVWWRHPWWPLSGTGTRETDRAGQLAALTSSVQVRPGLVVDADAADPGHEDDAWLDGLVLAAGSSAARGPAVPRIALAGSSPLVERWQGLIGRRPGLAVELALPARDGAASAAAVFVPCAPGRNLTGEVSAAASAAEGRPVLAEVTVSVGRTAAEARARADADELFTLAGHPARQGLFGTLEECQATAAQLAHAGATELICYLPLASDLPDVLAQLRSIAIGAGVLRPGEPPSAPPPPPAGWGGRRFTA